MVNAARLDWLDTWSVEREKQLHTQIYYGDLKENVQLKDVIGEGMTVVRTGSGFDWFRIA